MATVGGRKSGETQNRFSLDTVVEDEGLNLSVGERSLVSLARASVKDARIVLLDEATASVDYETVRFIPQIQSCCAYTRTGRSNSADDRDRVQGQDVAHHCPSVAHHHQCVDLIT